MSSLLPFAADAANRQAIRRMHSSLAPSAGSPVQPTPFGVPERGSDIWPQQTSWMAPDPLLPGEDAEDRELLFAGLHRDLAPEGAWEEELVDRIGDAMWRLRRVARVETALFAYRMLEGLKGDGRDRLGAVLPVAGVLPGATYLQEDLRIEGLYVFNESAESLADQSDERSCLMSYQATRSGNSAATRQRSCEPFGAR